MKEEMGSCIIDCNSIALDFSSIINFKAPKMRNYVRVAGTVARLNITSCQMWLILLKLVEHARWGRWQHPVKMYTDRGKMCWARSSSVLKLGNDTICICVRNNNNNYYNDDPDITNGGWYVLNAKVSDTQKVRIIALKGIRLERQANGFNVVISECCKRRMTRLLANTMPWTHCLLYISLQGGAEIGSSANNYLLSDSRGVSALSSRSMVIPYCSVSWIGLYAVWEYLKLIREHKQLIKVLRQALWVSVVWKNKLAKLITSDTCYSCGTIYLGNSQYPERQRRIYEIQKMCDIGLPIGTQPRVRRLPWSRPLYWYSI